MLEMPSKHFHPFVAVRAYRPPSRRAGASCAPSPPRTLPSASPPSPSPAQTHHPAQAALSYCANVPPPASQLDAAILYIKSQDVQYLLLRHFFLLLQPFILFHCSSGSFHFLLFDDIRLGGFQSRTNESENSRRRNLICM
jgi:hypothetical protein